jgi:hypothetical protein
LRDRASQRIEGVSVIPTSKPSGLISRVTIWPGLGPVTYEQQVPPLFQLARRSTTEPPDHLSVLWVLAGDQAPKMVDLA